MRSVSSGLSPDGQRFRGGYSGPLPAAMGFSAAGLPLVPNDGQYPLPYPAACLRGGLFCRLAAGRAQRFFGLLAGRAAVLGRLFRPAPCASGFFGAGLSLLPAGWTAGETGCRIAHHLRGGSFPYLPISPIFPVSLFFPKSSLPFVPPPVFLHRVTRRSLFLPAGISGSVPASPAEKPRKLLFQNPEWLFSLRFFRISPGFSLSLKV